MKMISLSACVGLAMFLGCHDPKINCKPAPDECWVGERDCPCDMQGSRRTNWCDPELVCDVGMNTCITPAQMEMEEAPEEDELPFCGPYHGVEHSVP